MPATARLKYSADELKSLRHSHKRNRSVRKSLFKYNIWQARTRSELHREAYRYQCQVVGDELGKAKSEHCHNKLSEADNHKDVYLIANSLLFGPKVQNLPTHDSVEDLSEQSADYFIQKIVTIHNGLCQNINTDNQCDETQVISIFGSLKPATNEEISKIICSSASKSCDLNPIPTWLLKLCLSELLPVITYIVNLSLSPSTVPYELKLTLITPLLKKCCWIQRSLITSPKSLISPVYRKTLHVSWWWG